MKERRIKNLMYRNIKESLEGIKQSDLPCIICGWVKKDTIQPYKKKQSSKKERNARLDRFSYRR